ncbi:MAG: O-antigen ligase family protein, partial [Coraliomargaritaceae bacterium]
MAAPPTAPREFAVFIVGSITLAASSWLFGGVELWSLHTLLVGSALTFLLAVCPLPAAWNGSDGEHGNKKNLIRLLRFPVFWGGLFLLFYIALQASNTAWEMKRSDQGWWVEEIKHITWLPSSVEGDYEKMNAFRMLSSFSAAFLLVWGLWVGIRRRRSALLVLWTLAISGTAMAMVGIIQKFAGADAVLWSIKSANKHFWGSFFYRNQAVGYLVLILGASAVLYFYHYNRSEKTGQSGGPHLLLFAMLVMVFASICMALSRGGILFGGIFVIGFLLLALIRWGLSFSIQRSLALSLLAAVLLGGAAWSASQMIDFEAIQKRFGNIEETIQNADQDSRALCTKITWKMAQEELIFGWGAGSWRYIFPMYQKSYPSIFYARYHKKQGWIGRKFYKEAHNDVVQYFFELGIIGSSFLLLCFLYWIFSLLFRSGGNFFSALILLLGLLVAFAHAFVEFIFQSPAYWLAFNGLLCVSA